MKNDVISALRAELKQQADEKTMASAQSFFKEKVLFYGVKSAIVDKISRKYLPEIKHLSKQEIFSL